MSNRDWQMVRELLPADGIYLGPYFAQQILESPRHLLFTLSRYKFAAKTLPTGVTSSVLELGCGEGIGTLMLAEGGHNITAVDFDEEAIGYATELLKKKNIYFVQGDILGNIFGKFDAVVSLDVIEHIPQSDEDRFMATVRDNLAGPGQCLIGTPNITAAQYASPRSAAGHVNLFDAERLASLVGRYFEQVFMFGMNDEVAHTGYFPMCHYLMALGTGKRSTTL